MSINISIYLLVSIAILPAFCIFLLLKAKFIHLNHQRLSAETDSVYYQSQVLDLEKEIVSLKNKSSLEDRLSKTETFSLNDSKIKAI